MKHCVNKLFFLTCDAFPLSSMLAGKKNIPRRFTRDVIAGITVPEVIAIPLAMAAVAVALRRSMASIPPLSPG